MLEIKNVSYHYPNKHVLENINLHLNKGEFISIIGGSGVGKTTLFHLIAGLLPLQTGEILIDGYSEYKNRISYMLQKDMLLEHKSVIDNIILPLLIQKIDKKKAREEALKLLNQVGLMDVADHYPKQLSGGMRQRIALLRTYMFKRNILLLDEAFSALDAHTRVNMHQWYLKYHKDLGLSSILITHDIDEAIILSDRIYVLGNQPGEIILELEIKDREKFSMHHITDNKFIEYKKILLEAIGF